MDIDPREAIDRIRSAFGPKEPCRSLHAKGRFYTGTFTASGEAATLCRAAHLQGDPVPVTVRWSNAGGNPRVPDKAPDIRGMAVKFHGPSGDSDLLGQTAPRFPFRVPAHFIEFTELAHRPYLLPVYMVKHPSSALPFLENLRAKALASHHSFAEVHYHPIHAYGWESAQGHTSWVRYTFAPEATPADRLDHGFSGRDRLSEEMVARLQRAPVRFDVRVAIAGDGDDPHDPMSVWKRARELSAGTIEVTGPVPDPEEGGGPVVFDPTRIVDGLTLSDDPILRYRPGAYSESVSRRV